MNLKKPPILIRKATEKDTSIIILLGKITFIESHGISAPESIILEYVNNKFSEQNVKTDLENPSHIYHLLYYENQAIGYSKIIYNSPIDAIEKQNITKLERLYILKEFHNLKLGFTLFEFNLKLCKENNQEGIWLFVWTENHKAIGFYNKTGFVIVGKYYFQLSANHANPNHQMFLEI